MARLPTPGQDSGTWGQILNEFLGVEHNPDGTLKANGTIAGKSDDSTVVHKAAAETITGAKNFTGGATINGTNIVVTSDTRLTDQRVPTDGSVTDAKIATTLSPSKITGTAIVQSTITTRGDLLAGTGNAAIARLGVGSDGQMLTAASGQTTGLSWTTPPGALMLNAKDNGLVGDGTTNDQPALQALVNTLGAAYASDGKPRIIFCPASTYAMKDNGTVWKSGVSLVGAGPGVTRFKLSNAGNPTNPTPLATYTVAFDGATSSTPLVDCTFANLEVDGSGVSLAAYSTGAKAFVLQFMVRARFYNLYLHDCGATGLGCDFLQDSIIDGVVAIGNGRLNNGNQAGGAGIGIGIGGWGTSERTTIANCTAKSNGTHGIFVELQNNTFPPPRGIRIVGCHSEANKHGISDWGADGLVVSSCTIIGNTTDGFNVAGSGVAGIAGRGGLLTDCLIDGNTLDGVLIGDTSGKYTVRGNRISNNGRHGIHFSNTTQAVGFANTESVIESNDIFLNANCGIRIDGVLTDGFILSNRIRNNGTATGSAADLRAGISFNQAGNTPTMQNNRAWDNQGTKTQTYGVCSTASGSLGTPVMQNNNFNSNLTGAWSFIGSVSGGNLVLNLGMASGVTTSAQTMVVDGAELVNGGLRYSGATRSFVGTALTPSATANTNGTSQTCSPNAGQQGFVLFSMIRAVFAGTFSSETATVTITATFSDNSTLAATLTATTAGTQVLASSGLLSLAKDGLYAKSVSFALQSTIGSSLVTATPSLVGAQC